MGLQGGSKDAPVRMFRTVMIFSNIRPRVFILAATIALLISYVGIWARFINDPVERTGSDFIAFYSAGRVAQKYGTAHVYDLSLQKKVQEDQVNFPLLEGQMLPFIHPPVLVPVLRYIVGVNYVDSLHHWVMLMIAVHIIAAAILGQYLRQASQPKFVVPAAAGSLLFLPFFFSLMNGQDTAVLFLGAAIWMYGLFTGRELLSGVGLSLVTIRPHIALALGVPMLFRFRKVFWGFAMGSGILMLLSVSLLGKAGTQDFIDIMLLSAGGEAYGLQEPAMFNLIGLLARTAPWLGMSTIRLVGWISYALAIAGLCRIWSQDGRLRDGQVGLSVVTAIFFAPHLHFHDLTLLLIPIYEVLGAGRARFKVSPPLLGALPLGISLILLVGNAAPFLQYSIPYLIMMGLSASIFHSKNGVASTKPRRS